MQRTMKKIAIFDHFISEIIQGSVMCMANRNPYQNGTSFNEFEWSLTHLQWPTNRKLYGLSNGVIFNDLEQPLTKFSKSCYSLTINISQTAKHTDIAFKWCLFQWPWTTQTQISRSRHYLKLNILETVIGGSRKFTWGALLGPSPPFPPPLRTRPP